MLPDSILVRFPVDLGAVLFLWGVCQGIFQDAVIPREGDPKDKPLGCRFGRETSYRLCES